MRKPFELAYFNEHPDVKVVTRDGRRVRIICTDVEHFENDKKYPIGALIHDEMVSREYFVTLDESGKFFLDSSESEDDLFFELPELRKKKVPLTYEDLRDRARAGKTMWFWFGDDTLLGRQIIGFNKTRYTVADGIGMHNAHPFVKSFPYEELMMYRFADGDPCWKEETV